MASASQCLLVCKPIAQAAIERGEVKESHHQLGALSGVEDGFGLERMKSPDK